MDEPEPKYPPGYVRTAQERREAMEAASDYAIARLEGENAELERSLAEAFDLLASFQSNSDEDDAYIERLEGLIEQSTGAHGVRRWWWRRRARRRGTELGRLTDMFLDALRVRRDALEARQVPAPPPRRR